MDRPDENDPEYDYASTYEELNEAPAWSHFGVGKKEYIPTLVPGVIANGFYAVFMLAIALGVTSVLFKYLPWFVALCAVLIFGFAMWVKSRWENIIVHRLAIWWNPDKVLLFEALCDEEVTETTDFDASEIHQTAQRFASEAYIALARAQSMEEIRAGARSGAPETFPELTGRQREHAEALQEEIDLRRGPAGGPTGG